MQSIHPAPPPSPPRLVTRSRIRARAGQRVPWHSRAGHSTQGHQLLLLKAGHAFSLGHWDRQGHHQHREVQVHGPQLSQPPALSAAPSQVLPVGQELSPHPIRLQPPPVLPQFPHPSTALTLYPRVTGMFPCVRTPMLAPAPLLPASPGSSRPGSVFVQGGPDAASPSSPLPEGSSWRWLHPVPALASLGQGAGSGLGSSTASGPAAGWDWPGQGSLWCGKAPTPLQPAWLRPSSGTETTPTLGTGSHRDSTGRPVPEERGVQPAPPPLQLQSGLILAPGGC